MEYELWSGLVEFAVYIELLIRDGWSLERTYGEQRLGIKDSLVFTKGERSRAVRSTDEFEVFLREWAEECAVSS